MLFEIIGGHSSGEGYATSFTAFPHCLQNFSVASQPAPHAGQVLLLVALSRAAAEVKAAVNEADWPRTAITSHTAQASIAMINTQL